MNSETTNGKTAEDGSGKASPTNVNASGVGVPCGGSSTQSSRICLTEDQLESITLEELCSHWRHQDVYIDSLVTLNSNLEGECTALRESEDKLKQQLSDLALRERVLVRRLAAKEQDMQEYAGQLSEMKGGQTPGMAALRNALLDPAVNILLQKLRQELAATRTRLDDTQNELAAWKFTPDSNTGKRLMAKCRLLYQENEELGRMVSNGRLAKLEGDLALQKSFSEEVKKSQSELDELLQDLDEDVEGMQSTIYYLQQELRKAKETVVLLEQENVSLKNKSDDGVEEERPKSPSCIEQQLNGVVIGSGAKWCPEEGEQTGEGLRSEVDRTTSAGSGGSSPEGGSCTGASAVEGGDHRRTDCCDDDEGGPPPSKKSRNDLHHAHYNSEQQEGVVTNGNGAQ
ncbi:hypothetical protein AAG570_003385 [Ranatra chinensis]|uniref:Pre-mRNA-splicing regulator WTAP n=1 Tax=Ranatra chinensis TaxID=642074 RepID=A0ABD0YG17_9HEMI